MCVCVTASCLLLAAALPPPICHSLSSEPTDEFLVAQAQAPEGSDR